MKSLSCIEGKVIRLPIARFEDQRGLLTVIQLIEHGFLAARAFVVTAPAGAVRGGHGHRKGRQILMHLSGAIDVEVAHQGRTELVRLDENNKALLIEPPVWSSQTYVVEHSSMIVFCDTPYDPEDYIGCPDEADPPDTSESSR